MDTSRSTQQFTVTRLEFAIFDLLALPAKSLRDPESNANQTPNANHAVTNPEGHELSYIVGGLEGRQETEPTECRYSQKKKRPQNGNESFHDFSGLLIALSSRFLRHLSLQYFTSSQTGAHFFRQVNGRPQTTQRFSGKLSFLWDMAKPCEFTR